MFTFLLALACFWPCWPSSPTCMGNTEGLTITRWKLLNLPWESMTVVMSATLSFLTQSSACASLCTKRQGTASSYFTDMSTP